MRRLPGHYFIKNSDSKNMGTNLINSKLNCNTMAGIGDLSGKRHLDHQNISSVFVSFYKSLYKSDNNSTKEELELSYLQK